MEESVIIGRLKKKIAKLTLQRDHFKDRTEYFTEMIKIVPSLESRYTQYLAIKKDREYVTSLEARVKEQTMLIKKLTE